MNGTQIRQTPHTGTSAAMCSLFYSDLAGPIGQHHSPFSGASGKISKRHAHERNELYLFVGNVRVSGGLATVRHILCALSELGGNLTVPLGSPPVAGAGS